MAWHAKCFYGRTRMFFVFVLDFHHTNQNCPFYVVFLLSISCSIEPSPLTSLSPKRVMNLCLNPPKIPKGTKNSPPATAVTGHESMADIMAMLKSQGVDMKGFEAEAEDIWETLNNMSEKSPEEYRQFIENQMMDMKDDIINKTTTSTTTNQSTNPPKTVHTHLPGMIPGIVPSASKISPNTTAAEEEDKVFRPVAGFSLSVQTTSGDGLKIRAEGQGKILFVNFCSHGALEPPFEPQYGRVLDMSTMWKLRSADGLQVIYSIPLSILYSYS